MRLAAGREAVVRELLGAAVAVRRLRVAVPALAAPDRRAGAADPVLLRELAAGLLEVRRLAIGAAAATVRVAEVVRRRVAGEAAVVLRLTVGRVEVVRRVLAAAGLVRRRAGAAPLDGLRAALRGAAVRRTGARRTLVVTVDALRVIA